MSIRISSALAARLSASSFPQSAQYPNPCPASLRPRGSRIEPLTMVASPERCWLVVNPHIVSCRSKAAATESDGALSPLGAGSAGWPAAAQARLQMTTGTNNLFIGPLLGTALSGGALNRPFVSIGSRPKVLGLRKWVLDLRWSAEGNP